MKLGAAYRSILLGAILCGANCFTAIPVVGAEMTAGGAPAVAMDVRAAGSGALELLGRVRSINDDLYANLQSFVCHEQIDRFKGSLTGEDTQHIDTVTTKVSFENGLEHYSEILQDHRPRTAISSVPGAWSEGEFGTLLQQTQILLNIQPVKFVRYTELEGTAAAVFEVAISAGNSPWDLEVAHRHYKIPFRTEVWVARATGEIVQIERISTAIPPAVGISEMRWGVTLHAVQMGQKSWLLPTTGTYSVLYRAGRREWNELTFSEYRRYGSEVALRYQ